SCRNSRRRLSKYLFSSYLLQTDLKFYGLTGGPPGRLPSEKPRVRRRQVAHPGPQGQIEYTMPLSLFNTLLLFPLPLEPLHALLDDLFVAAFLGLVEALAGDLVREVALLHVAAVVVWVAVPLAVAHSLHEGGRCVADLHGDREGAASSHLGERPVDPQVACVRFGRGGEVADRLGQDDPPLGKSHQLEGLQRGNRQLQAARIGVADVLGGEDHHAAQDEDRVLPRLQEARQPVERGV